MRSLIIDDINADDCQKLMKYFTDLGQQTSLSGVFWLSVPQELLSVEQRTHSESCGPHVLAIEVDDKQGLICLELLVRAQNALHCSCVGYAHPALSLHMLTMLDEILESLAISH